MAYDCNGNKLAADIRREADGTWSRIVWAGFHNATNYRRYYGYRTRRAARAGDISESAAQTNRRLYGADE